MQAIVFDDVSKHFPNTAQAAVDHASLSVDDGELVVLLGPSGCGKTTLLKMVNRLYEPSSGTILVNGQDIRSVPVTQLRRGIGYVIQQVGLFPHLRIAENIATVPKLIGWQKERIDRRVDELLELVGLPLSYKQRYPRQLSGGEQQRVGLARALAADPEILLMDEPFAAIDAINRSFLQQELLKIQEQVHKTILFVTHDVEEALRLADRLLVMQKGHVIQYGPPLQVVSQPATEFVHNLLGSGDILRRLSLLNVNTLLQQEAGLPATGEKPSPETTVKLEDDLRTVLARLLSSSSPTLTVVNDEGQPAGQIGFSDLRRALLV